MLFHDFMRLLHLCMRRRWTKRARYTMLTISYYVISCYSILHYVIVYHIYIYIERERERGREITLYCIILHYLILYYIDSWRASPQHKARSGQRGRYVMSQYSTLYHTTS